MFLGLSILCSVALLAAQLTTVSSNVVSNHHADHEARIQRLEFDSLEMRQALTKLINALADAHDKESHERTREHNHHMQKRQAVEESYSDDGLATIINRLTSEDLVSLLRGSPGTPGRDGIPGTHGLHGTPGNPGSAGQKGEVGEKGSQGADGVPGEQGATGPAGGKGEPGVQGPPGLVGIKGQPGIQGVPGSVGLPGEKGDAGEVGEVGAPGAPGIIGLPGIKGDSGEVGPVGEQGKKGDRGEKGQSGEVGAPGQKGEMGQIGAMGETGAPGIRGTKGDQGMQGGKGEQGPRGLKGQKGEKGESERTCDAGWLRGSASCYKFVTSERKTWDQAVASCSRMGGWLARLHDRNAIEWVKQYRRTHSEAQNIMWIGGYHNDRTNTWLWKTPHNDYPISEFDWGAGEPNNHEQDCLALFQKDKRHKPLLWDDEQCWDRFNYICEKALD